jgi:hypothetical protein
LSDKKKQSLRRLCMLLLLLLVLVLVLVLGTGAAGENMPYTS